MELNDIHLKDSCIKIANIIKNCKPKKIVFRYISVDTSGALILAEQKNYYSHFFILKM